MNSRAFWIVAALLVLLAACASGTADTTSPGDAGADRPDTRPTTTVGEDPSDTTPTPPGVPRADPVEPPAEKGPFFFESADVQVMESFPIQVAVVIEGAVPTPCDSPGWSVEIVDGEIDIEVFSIPLNDPAVSCIAVIEEVTVRVPLGSFEDGAYTVFVNGEDVGGFEA